MLKKKTTLTVTVDGNETARIEINGREYDPETVDRQTMKLIELYRQMAGSAGSAGRISFETISFWWEA